MDVHLLPEHLLYEILLFVPFKYLLRFKTLSKHWRDVISSQEFAADHLLKGCKSRKQSHHVISFSSTARSITLYPGTGEPFMLDIPAPKKECNKGGFAIQSSCRGLLCATFSTASSRYIILWNPVTRTCRELPDSAEIFGSGSEAAGIAKFALGFDPTTNDFKVVKMTSARDLHRKNRIISILSLKSNCLAKVEDQIPYLPVQRAVSIDGYIFWLAKGLQDNHAILKFNLACHQLTTILLPPEATTKTSSHEQIRLSLHECGGSVSLVRFELEEGIQWNMKCIWLLIIADRTWKDISSRYKAALHKSFRGWEGPVGFTSEAAVVIDRRGDHVISKEDSIDRIGVRASLKDAPHHVLHFESLVSPWSSA